MKLCEHCGAPAEDNARFCTNCGSGFPEETVADAAGAAAQAGSASYSAAGAAGNESSAQTGDASFTAAGAAGNGSGTQAGAYSAPETESSAQQTQYEHVDGEVQEPGSGAYRQSGPYAGAGNTAGGWNNGAGSSADGYSFSIIAYITWIGLLIAFLAGDKNDPHLRFHLNQSLVIHLFAIPGAIIPFVGWIWSLFLLVCWIMGLVSAIQGQRKEVPLIGVIHILSNSQA